MGESDVVPYWAKNIKPFGGLSDGAIELLCSICPSGYVAQGAGGDWTVTCHSRKGDVAWPASREDVRCLIELGALEPSDPPGHWYATRRADRWMYYLGRRGGLQPWEFYRKNA